MYKLTDRYGMQRDRYMNRQIDMAQKRIDRNSETEMTWRGIEIQLDGQTEI